MRKLRDYFATIPFLVAFGLTLVFYDIVGRIVRPFSLHGFEVVMAALQRTLISTFRICGTKVEIEKSDLIRPKRGYAIVSNHQSLFDIVLIGGMMFTNYPKYVAKKELGRGIPSVSLNLRHGGNAIIDRGDRQQALTAIEEMASTAQRRGVSVAIFPEGSRSRDGELRRFRRPGAQEMLTAANELPVVPVTVDGSWRLLEHNLWPVPFGTVVRVRFDDPIPRTDDDALAVFRQAESVIKSTLEEWRHP